MCRALEEEGVIEKVNLAEAVDCILNIAISEKKVQGCIRMNIDTRPYNKGAKHTGYHVTTLLVSLTALLLPPSSLCVLRCLAPLALLSPRRRVPSPSELGSALSCPLS